MIIRSGVSHRNRVDRSPARNRRLDHRLEIEHHCRHGFYTPTRTVIMFGREVEIAGPGRCPDPH